MMDIQLSYIVATRNRLPFLKITLKKLIEELQQEEEIVVVDGNSTDGSKEYLHELLSQGKIHQFVSEKDKNQAHAWNKAMLMAKGTIIKKVIDDDVFCYKAIRECKAFMLKNPSVDVVISNDLSCNLEDYQHVQKLSRFKQFEQWSNGTIPSFTFGDIHMLIRKSSLAYIGLYNPSYTMMDWEYSLKVSYLQANVVYYTGYNALSVYHTQTVSSLKDNKLVNEQGKKAHIFYDYKGDRAGISLYSKIKIFIGKLILPEKPVVSKGKSPGSDLDFIYDYLYSYLSEINTAEFAFVQKSK